MSIRTVRLDLIPATVEMLIADLAGPHELQGALQVRVPESWPPELYDADAIHYTLTRLSTRLESPAWWFHYFVLRGTPGHPAVVIGAGGYKGLPVDSRVEIGYSVLPEHRRRGYASEATRGLVANALAHPEVSRVIAQTLPGLLPSIGVLERCGFRFAGPGTEEGAVAYELTRVDWEGREAPPTV